MADNELREQNHFLICAEVNLGKKHMSEYKYLRKNFCGRVLDTDQSEGLDALLNTANNVYGCGDVELFREIVQRVGRSLQVINELSYNAEGIDGLKCINLAEVIYSNG